MHPKFILATHNGWKNSPTRCDAFTGKSLLVMRSRRKATKRRLCTKTAQKIRRALIATANGQLQKTDEITTAHMDLDMYKYSVPTTSEGMDTSTAMDTDVNMGKFAEPLSRACGSICANMTKPVNSNKYQKRLGAKKAKKLELGQNAEFALSRADATTYRALAARCNYLSQDRRNISFAANELCREFSIHNLNSFKKPKRLVRYLCGLPRLVSFQNVP